MVGLPCVNCKEPVGTDDAKFFAQTFVCSRCFAIAERTYVQGERQLRMMLVMLKECIRLAIIKGELQFPEKNTEDMPRKDLFAELSRLAQDVRQDAFKNQPSQEELVEWKKTQTSSTPTPTLSPDSTKLLAAGPDVGGPPSSGSTSE